MLDTGSLLVAATTFLLTSYIIQLFREKRRRHGHEAKKLQAPCLRSLPIVGSLPFLPKDLELLPDFFTNLADRLGPIYFFYAGRQLAVVINGKDAIHDATVKHSDSFSDRADNWVEKNICNKQMRGISFSRYHDVYRKRRKATLSIMREFGFGNNRVMTELIHEEVKNMVDEIVKHNGNAFDPEPLLVSCTSKVVIGILFGKAFRNSAHDHSVITYESFRFISNITPEIDAAPIIRFLPKFRQRIDNMVQSQTKLFNSLKTAIAFNKKQSAENSFVKRFFEIMKSDDEHDLLYLLRDLSMGSTSTISSSLMWGLGEIANHPQVLKRLHEEIDEAIPSNRFPELEDKERLPYTEATLLEIWRLRNLSPTLSQSTLTDTEACGYFVPKDCMVILNMHSIHMNTNVWTDPDEFRPERFLDSNNKVIKRDMVFPFGMGKRSCVGETIARPETFLFLASLVQYFDILPPEGCKSIDLVTRFALVISPRPYKLRFIHRRQIQLNE